MDEKEPKAVWSRYGLIVISALIVFNYHSGLEPNSYSVFGFGFSVKDPSLIIAAGWLGWCYAFYKYVHFLFEEGLNILRCAYAKCIARDLAVGALKERRRAAIERDPAWKGSNIKLKSIELERWDKHYISFSYRGDIEKRGRLSIGEELPLNSFSTQWSAAMRLKAFIHLLISRPLAIEILMPILIGLSPVMIAAYKFIFQ